MGGDNSGDFRATVLGQFCGILSRGRHPSTHGEPIVNRSALPDIDSQLSVRMIVAPIPRGLLVCAVEAVESAGPAMSLL